MKEEVKKRWVEALRSGDYKQAEGQLKEHDMYCCLGVLCDLYIQDHPDKAKWNDTSMEVKDGVYSPYQEFELPPLEVVEWAGLMDSNPEAAGLALTEWNDSKEADFLKISNLIQEYL